MFSIAAVSYTHLDVYKRQAQAAFWIKIGMLCELEPNSTYNEIMTRELKSAGLDTSLLS